MIYDFDYFSRYEQPELILCHPDDREIGVIQGVSDLKLVINLNEVSTLSYKIYNNDEELTKEGYATDADKPNVVKDWVPDPAQPNIYRLHKERREVHALGIGYFIITDIQEIEDSSGIYKSVSCKSCEYELNNISCPGVALNDVNMYPLYNSKSYDMLSNYERFKYLEDITTEEVDEDDTGVYKSESCILFNLLCYAPTWRLSDETIRKFNEDADYIALAATMRNLEDEDTTIYSYLKGKVSDAWEIFISFNIEDRTIDIYKYEDILIPSDTVLSEANILDKCEVKTDIDDYVNALGVTGGTDDLFISDFTKSGENVIYNFEHDIATGMIYGELKDALEYWNNLTDGEIPLDVPEGAKVPNNVCPDFYYDSYGNDLYRFLNSSLEALNDWSTNYELAKGKGSDAKDLMKPPVIDVQVGGSWTSDGSSTEGFDENVYGQYCLTITRALGQGDVFEVYFNGNDNKISYDPYLDPEHPQTTTAAQAAALLACLNADEPFTSMFTAVADSDNSSAIIITQREYGQGVPGAGIGNNQYNITGNFTITIKSVGHLAGKAEFDTYEYLTTDEGWEFGIRRIPTTWSESFSTGDHGDTITVSECRKVLQYFNEERNLAYSCNTYAQHYREAFETQKAALEEDRRNSQYADDDPSFAEQYANVLMYIEVAKNLELAYSAIENQIATWIDTVEQMLDETNYKRTFQGAFKEFYKQKYPQLYEDDIEDKTVKLYSKLIRVLKQQKLQDTSIVITDTMTMYEKYQQEEELYNKGVAALAKLIQPNAEISIDAEPFMFNEDYSGINKNVKMGYCIYVALPNGEVPLYHLKQITVDYEAPSCQLVFGDRIRSSDPADIFGELQKAASSAANIVASERIDWGVNSSRINYLMKEKDADIITTMRAMENSVNNVTIDQNGLSCFAVDPITNLESYGFWGANGSLLFFDYDPEVGRVPKVAIGRVYKSDGSVEYGFWGDKILANSITAEKLAVGAISYGSNYIRNGSFEGVGGSGSTRKLSYWKNGITQESTLVNAIDYQAGADGTIIPYIIVGDKCAKISAPTTSTIGQVVDALSGDTYTLSFYYLFDGENDRMTCTVGNLTPVTLVADSSSIHKWVKKDITVVVNDGQTLPIQFTSQNGTAYIDAVMLAKGTNTQAEYSPHVSEVYAKYTSINEDGVNIYDGHLAIYDAHGEKKIYTEGQNLKVSGNIYADYIQANTAGNIAGWTITSDTLYKDDNGKKPTGWSSNTSHPAFWTGSDLTTIPSISFPSGSSYPEGFNSTGNTASGHAANFLLMHDGRLFARNADITGAIHATSLTLGTQDNMVPIDQYVEDLMDNNLGGWQVHDHYLSTTELQGYFTYLLGEPSQGSDWVIRAGTSNGSTLTTYFGVHADGCMYCRGAEIYGDVFVAGNIHVNDPNGGTGITKLGGSWTIGAYSLYTTNLGTGADNQTYILNDDNTFMLDRTGNAYSKGSFFTGKAHGTGIQIADYNIFFGVRGTDDDAFDSCCGAISLADENRSLAMSGYRAILFGQKVDGNTGELYGWSHRATMDFTTNTTQFYPVTSTSSYYLATNGDYFKTNTGIYVLWSNRSGYYDEHGDSPNAKTPRYNKSDTDIVSHLGTDDYRWGTLYVNNINMTGTITGLSISSLSSLEVTGLITTGSIYANTQISTNGNIYADTIMADTLSTSGSVGYRALTIDSEYLVFSDSGYETYIGMRSTPVHCIYSKWLGVLDANARYRYDIFTSTNGNLCATKYDGTTSKGTFVINMTQT